MPRKKKVSTEQKQEKRSAKEIEKEIIEQVRLFASHKVSSAVFIMDLGKELLALEVSEKDF